MPKTQNRGVLTWILTFASFAVFLVVYGGFVRLTRSGLSIVEWNPVLGAVPPLSQQTWQAEFAKYQLTPEYRQINFDMTIGQYKEIFIVEWLHRAFARMAGLIFAVPFLVFALNGTIPFREIGIYAVMGVLFLSQAVLGWIMVSSGLVDQPAVSHYLLTGHLFLALALIGLSLWTALGHIYGFPDYSQTAKWSRASLCGAGGTGRAARSNGIWWFHRRAQSRPRLRYLAIDARSVGSAGLTRSGSARSTQFGGCAAHCCFHPPLVGICGPCVRPARVRVHPPRDPGR